MSKTTVPDLHAIEGPITSSLEGKFDSTEAGYLVKLQFGNGEWFKCDWGVFNKYFKPHHVSVVDTHITFLRHSSTPHFTVSKDSELLNERIIHKIKTGKVSA